MLASVFRRRELFLCVGKAAQNAIRVRCSSTLQPARVRKLSGAELSALAEQLVNSQDPVEAARVRETIVRGFYGAKDDA